ncbi:MAG: hypothetical protein ACP5JP_07015 [bacterium]
MRNKDVWIFIFLVGLLGFSWPIIEIMHAWVSLYLFIFWITLIIIVALLSRMDDMQR